MDFFVLSFYEAHILVVNAMNNPQEQGAVGSISQLFSVSQRYEVDLFLYWLFDAPIYHFLALGLHCLVLEGPTVKLLLVLVHWIVNLYLPLGYSTLLSELCVH